jgi:putative transposase
LISRNIDLHWATFGAIYPRRLERKYRGYGDTFYIDEVFIKINGKQHYRWRAVDQDGEVVDVYLQAKPDGAAAKQFFKRYFTEVNLSAPCSALVLVAIS